MCVSAEPTHLALLPLWHPDIDGGEVIVIPRTTPTAMGPAHTVHLDLNRVDDLLQWRRLVILPPSFHWWDGVLTAGLGAGGRYAIGMRGAAVFKGTAVT